MVINKAGTKNIRSFLKLLSSQNFCFILRRKENIYVYEYNIYIYIYHRNKQVH